MLVIFLRSLILYIVVFLVVRLMGKRELSKVQPFELVIIILIADLAAAPLSSRGMPIFDGIIPMITLLISYIILTYILHISNKVQEVVCGKVSVIIEDGKILEEELKKNQYVISDIMAQLRQKGVFKIQQVKYAVIETNGDLNVITMDDKVNTIPLNIIEDGKLNETNVQILNLDNDKVDSILNKEDLKIENILVGTIDENGEFMYQLKKEVQK